jgi:hypothetical protein
MERPQYDSLQKAAGNLVIAWGVVSIPMSFATGMLDCGALVIIWAGFAVHRGSRTGSFFALIFSAVGFIGEVAVLVSAATHGIDNVGQAKTIAAAGFGVWMLLNMALLTQLRSRKPGGEPEQSENQVAASPHEILLAPKTEPDGQPGDVVFTPLKTPRRWLPQFSLRSLFVLAILVALGSAIGTQPVGFHGNWSSRSNRWDEAGPSGSRTYLEVFLIISGSGHPAIGFLWRSQNRGNTPAISVSSSDDTVRVNGQVVSLGRNFVLFYNDAENKLQRLDIPKEEAIRVFSQLDESQIEKFWREKIEPLRKMPSGKAP